MSAPRARLEHLCQSFSEVLMGVCSSHPEREVRMGQSGAVLCSPQGGFWLPSLNPLGQQQHTCDKGQCSVWASAAALRPCRSFSFLSHMLSSLLPKNPWTCCSLTAQVHFRRTTACAKHARPFLTRVYHMG